MRILVAGAAGVIGRRLVPLLIADGHTVFGTTRARDRADWLKAQGVEPVLTDVFDRGGVREAMAKAAPTVVIHQLTDLADIADAARLPEVLARNARIRDEGTRNLLDAARTADVRRVIAQSIAFAYAPGRKPYRESDLLNIGDPGPAGVSARGVASLEAQVLGGPWIGIALRYGRLYGPGAPPSASPPAIHVDAAAETARHAAASGDAGVYNVVEEDGFADGAKARSAFRSIANR